MIRASSAARTGRQTSSVPRPRHRFDVVDADGDPPTLTHRPACTPRADGANASTFTRMKIVSIVGNRPQFIKAAPVAAALDGLCDHDGRSLDELRAVAHDGDDLHPGECTGIRPVGARG